MSHTIHQEKITNQIWLITLCNQQGTRVSLTNLGASITQILVKDREGQLQDIVLGYPQVEAYAHNTETYFGATVGRTANRTKGAQVTIQGKHYPLEANEGQNNLHSGPKGYQIRIWEVHEISEAENAVSFQLFSPDGDQGFPGNLTFTARFQLTEENELILDYTGTSDQVTIFNPTNHSYFNLNGQGSGSVHQHVLQLRAAAYTPIDEESIPTGEIRPVSGTPFDFRQGKTIGQDIAADDEQLRLAQGYDHNFAIESGFETPFARVYGEKSGIQLEVYSNLPGVQLYTGNFLQGQAGKGSEPHHNRDGFCLETQFFPDAVHHSDFASPLIPAHQTTTRRTIFKFGLFSEQ